MKGEPYRYKSGHWSRMPEAKPILAKNIKVAQPLRHAQMKRHRNLGPWKAGSTMRVRYLLKKLEGKAAP